LTGLAAAFHSRRADVRLRIARVRDGTNDARGLVGCGALDALIGLARHVREAHGLPRDLAAIRISRARPTRIRRRIAERSRRVLAVDVRETRHAGLRSCVALGLRSVRTISAREARNAGIRPGVTERFAGSSRTIAVRCAFDAGVRVDYAQRGRSYTFPVTGGPRCRCAAARTTPTVIGAALVGSSGRQTSPVAAVFVPMAVPHSMGATW
jgi:hypothetical protein